MAVKDPFGGESASCFFEEQQVVSLPQEEVRGHRDSGEHHHHRQQVGSLLDNEDREAESHRQQREAEEAEADDADADKSEEAKSEMARLEELFPGLDSNPEIKAIKEMFARGCIYKKRAQPRFFDGLLYVMEQDWTRCVNVLTIFLELIPGTNYEQKTNIFLVSGVMNELIDYSTLQSLTLKQFPPDILLASLATLRDKEQLDYIDVSHSSLGNSGMDTVIRWLPPDPIDLIEANFEHNDITDESDVGLLLRNQPNLKSVKIAAQGARKLDLKLIQARINTPIELL